MPTIVTNCRCYKGCARCGGTSYLAAETPDRFIPGNAVGISPPHEEAGSWRAILAGFDSNGDAYVVPLTGHFGKLVLRKVERRGANGPGLFLSRNEPVTDSMYGHNDDTDFVAARTLAMSAAVALDLTGAA